MRHRLNHPADQSGRWARTEPYPHDFRPKHCAGALDRPSGCLHHHAGDQVCGCGRAVLGPENEVVILQVRPHNATGQVMPFVRHSRESCHQVSAASMASGAVSA